MLPITLFISLCLASTYASPLGAKLVGGTDAYAGQFPYIVEILLNGRHHCGGSILNQKWILTAAHCLRGYELSSLTVVAGSLKKESGETYELDSYEYKYQPQDIGLIKLKNNLQFNQFVQPIELNEEEIETEDEVVVSGWGWTSSITGARPDYLQYIVVKNLPNKDCASVAELLDTEMCTLSLNGKGICFGDSGGPLVWKGKLAGIVEKGTLHCGNPSPNIFTKVSSYVDWIKEEIQNE